MSSSAKPRLVTINNLTYADGGPKQSLLQPNQPSYVDYFWVSRLLLYILPSQGSMLLVVVSLS